MSEKNVALRGHSVSSAAARITELATEMEFNAVPTAPRTYQLVRQRRRRLLGKRIETMTITLVEDRSGTRARITGHIDDLFLRHLGGVDVADDTAERAGRQSLPTEGVADRPVERGSIDSAPRTAPSAQVPRRDRPAVRPAAAAPGGMISSVPGASNRPASPPPAEAVAEPVAPIRRVRDAVDPDPVVHAVEEHTVMRKRVDPVPVKTSIPSLWAPDGLQVQLRGPVVVGRNPDHARLAGAVAMAIDDRSISKTHASVEIIGDRLVVTDLHSSNGTWIDTPDGQLACDPGEPVEVAVATCVLRCGDAKIEVRVPA